ncbi:hypothetical protein HanXRQr2_Chr04g0191661 [Helianthus annuus]|uniref:DUF4228 domain protein n=1 Tax=Helianthus annuus TaxID=4232 RepID=A0A251V3Z3_HELAN|nr:uncharacterized protein LOC110934257 [Helianthus annuus]KAF5812356.1 hypothetical protein HanXRQr2_Chr04g0191661 [Helianthus annuus]KAJ0598903.1 hypothetical protein HanHA89_Chr04g0170791 [Helianthus annuus]
MGTCASILYPKLEINNRNQSSTAKVIHSVDGKLQEFRQPITASHVLSDHPDTFFLCSSENMFVNWHVPHVSGDEELEPGQIYFIMPVSKSFKPLSLQELCLLAVKASSAIEQSSEMEKKKVGKTMSFGRLGNSLRRNQKLEGC